MQTDEIHIPPQEQDQLRELYRMLQLGSPRLLGPHGEEIALPLSVYMILKEVARNMQLGRAVSVVPKREQLTTQMAANLLGCSRPHLVKLLDTGKIPFQKTGMHRRVRYQDLLSFQSRKDKDRKDALTAMAKEAVAAGRYEGTPNPEGGSDE